MSGAGWQKSKFSASDILLCWKAGQQAKTRGKTVAFRRALEDSLWMTAQWGGKELEAARMGCSGRAQAAPGWQLPDARVGRAPAGDDSEGEGQNQTKEMAARMELRKK